MCGITGSLQLSNKYDSYDLRVMTDLLYITSLRGTDGTGLVWGDAANPDKIHMDKSPAPAQSFLTKFEIKDALEDARWAIGHCRAATLGKIDKASSHPFHHGDVVGVHNGTINNMSTYFPSYSGYNDSDTLYKVLADTDPAEVGDVLREISYGAYALVWYDKRIKSLRFVRNSERPLYFYKENSVWWWSSEASFIATCLTRNTNSDLLYTSIEPWQLKKHTLLTLPIDGSPATVEDYVPKTRPITTGRSNIITRGYEDPWEDYIESRQPYSYQPYKAPANYNANTSTKDASKTEEEAPWLELTDLHNLWVSPDYMRQYIGKIYMKVTALTGTQGMMSGGPVFNAYIEDLATKLTGFAGGREIIFRGLHVDEASGMVYGTVGDEEESIALPVVGMLGDSVIKKHLDEADKADIMMHPLFKGKIESVMVYSSGELGLKVDTITTAGWDNDTNIKEIQMHIGDEHNHPHKLLSTWPDGINWGDWE
jgi:predicted glutamine amidotransferase